MHVRAIGAAGGTNVADDIGRGDFLAFLGGEGRHVQVDGFHALSVVNGNGAAAQIVFFDDLHNSCGNGMNGRSGRAALVNPGVKITGGLAILQAHRSEGRGETTF